MLFFAGSCTFIYYPTYPVVADPNGKSLNISGAIGFTKAQISSTYNLDSHIFVTGLLNGVLSTLNRDTANAIKNTYNSFTQMIGIGYKNKISPKMEFQIQGGLGNSKGYFRTDIFSIDNNVVLLDVDTRSFRTFIQPTFVITSKYTNVYFVPKLTYEMFSNVEQRKNGNYNSNVKTEPYNILFGEFFVLSRFIAKKINIDLYGGISSTLSGNLREKSSEPFIVQPFTIGFGLSKTIGL